MVDNEDIQSCASTSVSCASTNKENRFADRVLGKFSVVDKSIRAKASPWYLLPDDNDASTSAGGVVESVMDIDERSLASNRHNEFDIEDGSILHCSDDDVSVRMSENSAKFTMGSDVEVLDSPESPLAKRARPHCKTPSDAETVVQPIPEVDEQSHISSIRNNFALPKLPVDDVLPPPARTLMNRTHNPVIKRKLGPLSTELVKRIRSQNAATTFAHFRAFLTDDQQPEPRNEPHLKAPDSRIATSAWGIDMTALKDVQSNLISKNT